MKARSKKTLSLILAAVMLLAMVPMGVVSASAVDEGTATFAVDSSTYQDGAIFTITNIADWKVISAASADGKTFDGMTVTLADNAVIGGTSSETVDLPALFTTFMGTFDGNADGGAVIQYANATIALIAKVADGNVNVKDVKFSNVKLTTDATGCGLVVGKVNGGETTVTGVTMTNCELDVTANGVASAAVIGYIPAGKVSVSDVDITDIDMTMGMSTGTSGVVAWAGAKTELKIDDVNISGNINVSAVVASVKMAGVVAVFDGHCEITNTHVDLDLSETTATETDSSKYGGIVCFAGGPMGEGGSCVISDCTVSGAINGGVGLGAIGGIVCHVAVNHDLMSISNVTVDTDIVSSMTNRGAAEKSGADYDNGAYGYGVAGGIVSIASNGAFGSDSGDVILENIKITGSLTAANTNMGGLIGIGEYWLNNALNSTEPDEGFETAKNRSDTTVVVRNCEILPTITVNETVLDEESPAKTMPTVGMVVGCWGEGDGCSPTTFPMHNKGALIIHDTVIGGKINAEYDNYYIGGVIGYYGFRYSTVNIDNCLITTDMINTKIVATQTDTNRTGLIVGCDTAYGGALNVACATTQTGEFKMLGKEWMANLNGHTSTGWDQLNSDDSLVTITAEEVADRVERDEDGKIVSISVYETIFTDVFTQYTNNIYMNNGVLCNAVRFIAVTEADTLAGKAGFSIIVRNSDGAVVKSFDTDACELYGKLNNYILADGIEIEEFLVAEDGDSKNAIAVIIKDIPYGAAYSFEVSPYYATAGGAKIFEASETMDFDEFGKLIEA